MRYSITLMLLLLAMGSLSAGVPPFRIEQSTVQTSTGAHHWSQSRAALIPGNPARVIVTTQQNEKRGSHGYRDVFFTDTTDGGRTWSAPQRVDVLARAVGSDGKERVMGDICPAWHAATGKLLLTGKTFGFLADAKDTAAKDDRSLERVAYAVYSPDKNEWSGMKEVTLPEKDHAGRKILEPNAGCNDRFDLPNGEILLPVRYRADPKTRQYTTIVAHCVFDGEKLIYKEHGSELTFAGRRGLYEPSIIGHGGKFYLTMRADESAFVSVSDDGLNYTPPAEWRYDDGKVLGSYNTQQHWITNGGTLWLIYTRRGANNDHVFRHRAPIFIAQVDPKKLCVLRSTEQVLMPETGVDLGGGFAALNVNASETWVISTEMAFPEGRKDEDNRIRMARIIWSGKD
ncbi:MAG TPA: sialidase family protein [Prosthecobacter sp.]